ncbi:pilus assembly protein [Xylanimonas oleitrophica]|uniref:pilus assembly protein n=1 Tax=Xylanimonas oleitrophica TaxID=2607479 RepID=UPI001FE3F564|nr:pilus assembly protein [Xylanimonas oleitrophica]
MQDEPPQQQGDGERGSAVVEFIGTAVLLLIPLIYLVLVAGRLQAGAFAAEGAAREAARAMVTASSTGQGLARAHTATAIAFADQGFDRGAAHEPGVLTFECSADPCLTPDASVGVRVRLEVPLPFVPSGLRGWVPLAVPVEAGHVAVVDRYADVGG